MKHKQVQWSCINNCGACCRLSPEERCEALNVLSPNQLETYMEMVGDDGWCINYDKSTRSCRIYTDRPDFCRVSNLPGLFDIEESELNSFAIRCCQQQIKSIYGDTSQVYRRFQYRHKLSRKK